MQEFLKELKKAFRGDVETSPEILKKYSHDASLFEIMPTAVVYPKDADDIKTLVKFVQMHKGELPELSLTVRAAGTDMSGGPLNDSIIVDVTRYMNKLGELNDKNRTMVTEPGVFYRDFEQKAKKAGLMYPAFPASKDICAMGGIVGNNGAGEKTLRYGQAENYIASLKIILSDGNEYEVRPLTQRELATKMRHQDFEGALYRSLLALIEKNYDAIMEAKPRVSKNASGYYLWNVFDRETKTFNLCKLIVGSQGTLGIVTEITMKLVPIDTANAMLAVFVHDRKVLPELIQTALLASPESIEAYDDKTIRLALKFWSGFIRKRGIFGALRLGFSFLPELWMMIRGGMPKLVVLVNFTGNSQKEVVQKVKELRTKLTQWVNRSSEEKFFSNPASSQSLVVPRVRKNLFPPSSRVHILFFKEALSKSASDKYWTLRHDAFTLLREHNPDRRTAPFIDDTIVPPEKFPEYLPQLESILEKYNLVYNIHGHAGNGNFHVIPLLDMRDQKNIDMIPEIADQVYDLVLSLGGSITAEHNDGLIRGPYLEKMYGPFIMGLFRQVKTLFDPENMFNPRKKIGVSREYMISHIQKE